MKLERLLPAAGKHVERRELQSQGGRAHRTVRRIRRLQQRQRLQVQPARFFRPALLHREVPQYLSDADADRGTLLDFQYPVGSHPESIGHVACRSQLPGGDLHPDQAAGAVEKQRAAFAIGVVLQRGFARTQAGFPRILGLRQVSGAGVERGLGLGDFRLPPMALPLPAVARTQPRQQPLQPLERARRLLILVQRRVQRHHADQHVQFLPRVARGRQLPLGGFGGAQRVAAVGVVLLDLFVNPVGGMALGPRRR